MSGVSGRGSYEEVLTNSRTRRGENRNKTLPWHQGRGTPRWRRCDADARFCTSLQAPAAATSGGGSSRHPLQPGGASSRSGSTIPWAANTFLDDCHAIQRSGEARVDGHLHHELDDLEGVHPTCSAACTVLHHPDDGLTVNALQHLFPSTAAFRLDGLDRCTNLLGIAADHAGLELKRALVVELERRGIVVRDLGTTTSDSCDYPDFAHAAGRAIQEGELEQAILLCGRGVGMSIVANRHASVRALVCSEPLSARMARQHNAANLLCIARTTSRSPCR